MKKVCVIGLGYIGLPTAVIAAEHGFDVVGFDKDQTRVARINACDPVIQEPEIFEKLQNVLTLGRFRATTDCVAADYFIIAVPTPFKEEHKEKKADLCYVWSAVESIAAVLKKNDTVILESTVPVGTTNVIATFLEEKTGLKAGVDFYCAHCPERVLPGKIVYELTHNPRIIGGINQASLEYTKEFYKKFVTAQLYLTNATAAEMIKLVENSYRDVQIAFANQVAAMATSIELDPYEVIELANKHPRVNILKPRCGVGGHCIAVDPWFLIETFPQHTELLRAARTINDQKPRTIVKQIANYKNKKILVLGVTFKPDVDDLRESPALFIAQELIKNSNNTIKVCEPHSTPEILAQHTIPESISFFDGLLWADIVICLVDHTVFKLQRDMLLEHAQVLDFCGLLHQERSTIGAQEQLFWPAQQSSMANMLENLYE